MEADHGTSRIHQAGAITQQPLHPPAKSQLHPNTSQPLARRTLGKTGEHFHSSVSAASW